MVESEINNHIFFSVTISVFLATAINFLMDKNLFKNTIVEKFSHYYGLSILFLILSYVFYYLIKNQLSVKEKNLIDRRMIFNLFFVGSLIFVMMYPYIFSFISILIIAFCITMNLMLPFMTFFNLLLKLFSKKIPIYHFNILTNKTIKIY